MTIKKNPKKKEEKNEMLDQKNCKMKIVQFGFGFKFNKKSVIHNILVHDHVCRLLLYLCMDSYRMCRVLD